MTELKNTPEGQAWQRMQLQQLAPREKQNALALTGVQNWYKTAGHEKHAIGPLTGGSAKLLAKSLGRFDTAKRVLPYLTGPGAVATGGGVAGWQANDAFLNEFYPEVTDVGRLRSNLRAGTMGATGGLLARGRVKNPVGLSAGLAGTGLGLRYGIITPSEGRLGGLGIGEYVDPGHAQIPKFLAWHAKPENQQKVKTFLADPTKAVTDYAENKVTKELDKQFVTPEVIEKNDGTKIVLQPPATVAAGKHLKEHTLPSVYASILSALGSPAKMKEVRNKNTGVRESVPDVQFSDIGTALAPHLAGGAGGAYLGYRTGDTIGNFLFPDNETDEYEDRRRQEQRRWWLQFLGGNLGAVGGTAATIKAMPHIREIMRAKTKTAGFPGATTLPRLLLRGTARAVGQGAGQTGRATGNFALERAKDLGVGAAITAGQYGLNKAVPGYVPSTEFDAKGNQVPNTAVADPWFVGGLTALNALASNPVRRALRRGAHAPAFSHIWPAGAFLTAGPSIVYPFRNLPALTNTLQAGMATDNSDKAFFPLAGDMVGSPSAVATRVGKDVADRVKTHYDSDAAKGPTLTALSGIAREAGVPGFGNDNLRKFINSAGLSTLAQGAGIATGGVGGMLAGDWLADKLLTAATNRKLIKKRPHAHRFIRDLSSLAGAGLGAYGALQGLDVKMPDLLKRLQPSPALPAANLR